MVIGKFAYLRIAALAAIVGAPIWQPVRAEENAPQHTSDGATCPRSTFRVVVDVGHTAPSPGADSARAPSDSTRRARPDSARGGRSQAGGAGGMGRRARGTDAGGGRYIVFVKRNGVPTPVWIRTGLTDLDYSEVVQGLQPGDSVYVLPSASLVQSQQDMRQRINQVTGGGAVPGMRQSAPAQRGP